MKADEAFSPNMKIAFLTLFEKRDLENSMFTKQIWEKHLFSL